MDNLDDLRLQVAKALGWGFFEMDAGQGYDEHHPHGYDGMQYAMPPGESPDCVGYGFSVHRVEMISRTDAFEDDDPDWPNDWNAAMELVKIAQTVNVGIDLHNIILRVDGQLDRWVWRAMLFDPVNGPMTDVYNGEAPTGPEAICRAFLAWKGANDGKES